MRIAFVAQPFEKISPHARESSIALWAFYTAKKCAERGHEVITLANCGKTFRVETANSEGVTYVFCPTGADRLFNKILQFQTPLRFRNRQVNRKYPTYASSLHHLGYATQVARRAKKMNCDVVHVMNYSQFVPVIRKIYPHCKISLHMHCEWLTQLDPRVMERRLQQTDLMIGCSEYITRKVAEKFPEYSDRCVTISNAAEVVSESNRSPLNNQSLLFVGRLSPEKGLHHLIGAFHLVLRRFPEARLHLVGGSSRTPLNFLVGISEEPHVLALQSFYKNKGSRLKDSYIKILEDQAGPELGKRIIFEGQVPHDQVSAYYSRAAALVNPSLSESFGISLIEAMMHGVPVVATRIGGMTYTVDHERTGYLVEPADPKSLAAAICSVLENRERAQKMGNAGRLRAIQKFSWSSSTEQLLRHYESLLRGLAMQKG